MTTLASERCEACHKDAPKVPESEEAALLEQIPEWRLLDVDGVKRLQRVFRFSQRNGGWRPAVDFTNRVAGIADAEDHHPAILTEWGRVTVTWWTHAIRGLHRNDFVMAAKTDELYRHAQPSAGA